jgi:hypothetical protein
MYSESAARRAAAKAGYRVCKSRERSQHSNNKGGLQLIDDRNMVILGWDFDSTPNEIISYLREPEKGER